MRKVGDGKTFSKSRGGCLRWLLLSSFPITRRNTAGCNNNNRFTWTHEETKIFLGLSCMKTFFKKTCQETLISTHFHGCLFILCLLCNLLNFRSDVCLPPSTHKTGGVSLHQRLDGNALNSHFFGFLFWGNFFRSCALFTASKDKTPETHPWCKKTKCNRRAASPRGVAFTSLRKRHSERVGGLHLSCTCD